MGGNASTFYGLSGLGDLALTCNSPLSRNFNFGLNFSTNLNTPCKGTFEGVKTAAAANKLAQKLTIEVPIINTIDLILRKKISLRHSIKQLLSRPLKKESI